MKWILIIGVLAFFFYRIVMVKEGNLDFWKIANSNPDVAFKFFESNAHFTVFLEKPSGGYRNNLPEGEWAGPFKLYVPSIQKSVTIYGSVPDYENEEEEFLRSLG